MLWSQISFLYIVYTAVHCACCFILLLHPTYLFTYAHTNTHTRAHTHTHCPCQLIMCSMGAHAVLTGGLFPGAGGMRFGLKISIFIISSRSPAGEVTGMKPISAGLLSRMDRLAWSTQQITVSHWKILNWSLCCLAPGDGALTHVVISSSSFTYIYIYIYITHCILSIYCILCVCVCVCEQSGKQYIHRVCWY